MSNRDDRMRQGIRRNIERHGEQVYGILQGSCPRFLYTVGLTETVGAELVLGGGAFFSFRDLHFIVSAISNALRHGASVEAPIHVMSCGAFTLRKAHPSWTRALALGASAYYGRLVEAYQVVPDSHHRTIDVPDMTTPWSPATEPGWRYLHETWSLPVPPGAYVVAGMDVLRGARVSVATRQDLDCWEMFSSVARPPVRDTRIVPLATLLGVDASLSRTLELAAGESLWRKELGASWHPLRARPAPPRTRRGAHS